MGEGGYPVVATCSARSAEHPRGVQGAQPPGNFGLLTDIYNNLCTFWPHFFFSTLPSLLQNTLIFNGVQNY